MEGVYTTSELIKSLIADLNALLKNELCGEYVMACVIVTSMAQKLANLQSNIDNDLKNRDETIEKLKDALRKCGHEIVEVTPEEI